jgi:hypothetical protein
VNSAVHVWGDQPWRTGDSSRNNALVALLVFGAPARGGVEGGRRSRRAAPAAPPRRRRAPPGAQLRPPRPPPPLQTPSPPAARRRAAAPAAAAPRARRAPPTARRRLARQPPRLSSVGRARPRAAAARRELRVHMPARARGARVGRAAADGGADGSPARVSGRPACWWPRRPRRARACAAAPSERVVCAPMWLAGVGVCRADGWAPRRFRRPHPLAPKGHRPQGTARALPLARRRIGGPSLRGGDTGVLMRGRRSRRAVARRRDPAGARSRWLAKVRAAQRAVRALRAFRLAHRAGSGQFRAGLGGDCVLSACIAGA